jgi:predicted secreted protein
MFRIPVLLAAALAAPLALAQSVTPAGAGPQVEISAQASREVANDLMTATVYVEASDPAAASVAATLNRVTADALKTAAQFPSVKARSGGNQTYPVYDRNNRQSGWRGRAEVRLESKDFQAMSELVGRLQSSMQLANIGFGVSPELKRQTENDLITEAVAAFRARADIATRALGGAQFRIRNLALNTGGQFPGPRPMARMSAAEAAPAPPPVFEGGTSQVQVGASGTIEVQ